MSGSNSSAPGSGAAPDRGGAAAAAPTPLSFAVHSMPSPADLASATDGNARRTKNGRLKMLLVLLVCATPVIVSYLTYFVIRPEGRTNYSELIMPLRPIPADLPLADLQGRSAAATSLKRQWLLIVVSGGACDSVCEKQLWLQRQLRETLGREKDRLDKIWLIVDTTAPRPETLKAVSDGTPATVLRVPYDALAEWAGGATRGQRLEDHMLLVDPMGNLMMRVPANPEPSKLKRDVEKLLRASASWDEPGR